jgi:acetyl-CoA carboxylase biotin carboxyl carrier protein
MLDFYGQGVFAGFPGITHAKFFGSKGTPFLRRVDMGTKSSIDQEMIRELAALLKETDLTEIEVEQDDLRIRVARGGSAVEVAAPVATAAPSSQPEVAKKDADPASHPGAVTSPMVGTAYHSPAPGSKPFVTVGDTVKAGQTVMIVEAMKTMNQIAAERAGTVTAVLVEDAQPVEYGEPLLIIE